jgi:streptomycin 3"-adenylyltransferase
VFRRELGDAVAGVYLHGSLATGCYYRPKSDIDLIVTVSRPLGDEERHKLLLALADASDARPTTGELELHVVLDTAARAAPHPMPYELAFGDKIKGRVRRGDVELAQQPAEARVDRDLAAHCTVTRARGVALTGALPAEAFGAVSHEAFIDAVLYDLEWILGDEHILESPFYGVLNGCRVLQLLVDGPGTVANKEEGALWGIARLPAEHRPVIQAALDAYRSDRDVMPANRQRSDSPWDAAALLRFRDYVAQEVAEDFERRGQPGSFRSSGEGDATSTSTV